MEKSMKKISCGTLIVRENNGIKELFMAHVTNKTFWDIPKGCVEQNESFISAAIREMYEESGFKCQEKELLDLGLFEYTERKDLYLFKYTGEIELNDKDAVCNSTFFSKIYQKRLPEVDEFRYIPLSEVTSYCSEGFKNVFPKLIERNII